MTSQDRDFPRPDDVEESRFSVSADPSSRGGGSADDATTSAAPSGKKQKKQMPLWQESILLLVLALGMALVVKTFFLQAFYIPSESMEPGLVQNDRILVQKVSYWNGGPERGDVIVFKDPGGWLPDAANEPPSNPIALVMTKIGLYPEGGHLVKRVIGVGGDVIECCDENGRLKVNGVAIDEPYIQDEAESPCNGPMTGTCEWTTTTVPEGHVFVMGDNRRHSADSTVHMCRDDVTDCVPGKEFVPVENVVGRLATVIWPFSHMRIEKRPDAFDAVPDAS